jgi:hypothetical protein
VNAPQEISGGVKPKNGRNIEKLKGKCVFGKLKKQSRRKDGQVLVGILHLGLLHNGHTSGKIQHNFFRSTENGVGAN